MLGERKAIRGLSILHLGNMLLRQPTPPFGTGYGQQTCIMIYTLLFHPLSRILRIVGCNSTYLGMKAADDANKYEYLDFRGETFENVREVLYKLLKNILFVNFTLISVMEW
jgi:hypothetical protein